MKKKFLFLMAAMICVTLNSCSDEDEPTPVVDYPAGEIPGLGEADGELTGTPFSLPDGVELTGEITGQGDQYDYWDYSSYSVSTYQYALKNGSIETRSFKPLSRTTPERHYYGSGKGYVDLLIPMSNTRNEPVTITFPAALILENVGGDSQNGILLKKVMVTSPANTEYHLNLSFYCGNAHRSSAGSSDVYTLGVVSDAAPLLDLCERVKNKKINIEEFDPTSYDDYSIYTSQKSRLQSIVWEVTDYDGLTEEDIEYLNSLPNSR